MLYIRRDVLGLTQQELADCLGVKQATVSRWDNGRAHPTTESQRIIRDMARKAGKRWSDSYFFEVPEEAA